MKKSEIVVGGIYSFNPKGRNRYGAFDGSEWLDKGRLEVKVVKIYPDGDVDVVYDGTTQIVAWRELRPLKTN